MFFLSKKCVKKHVFLTPLYLPGNEQLFVSSKVQGHVFFVKKMCKKTRFFDPSIPPRKRTTFRFLEGIEEGPKLVLI